MPIYTKRTESTLVTQVLRYLQILENSKKISFFNRQQAGSLPIQRNGKWSRIRLGREGVSDIWAILKPMEVYAGNFRINYAGTVWIECKLENGIQSNSQKEFQSIVEHCGHYYWVIRSCNELERQFKEIGVI